MTLLHFTSPVWLIQKGGWEAEKTISYFRRYADYIARELGGELKYICTINEANMGLQLAAISKRFVLMAQQAAEKAKSAEGTRTSRHEFREDQGEHEVRFGEEYAAKEWEEEFRHYLPHIEGDDFLGVQNYTRSLFGPEGMLPAPEGAELTQMEYEFYPEALENVIRKVHEDFKGDLIVTENGIPVRGYCHWSLMDNFEWQKGFSMTFGLIAVDRTTMKRTPKPSLAFLGSYTK